MFIKTKEDGWFKLFASIILAVLVGLMASYFFYVKTRQSYLANYYLRKLGDTGQAWQTSLSTLQGAISNTLADPPTQAKEPESDEKGTASLATLRLFVQNLLFFKEMGFLKKDASYTRMRSAIEEDIFQFGLARTTFEKKRKELQELDQEIERLKNAEELKQMPWRQSTANPPNISQQAEERPLSSAHTALQKLIIKRVQVMGEWIKAEADMNALIIPVELQQKFNWVDAFVTKAAQPIFEENGTDIDSVLKAVLKENASVESVIKEAFPKATSDVVTWKPLEKSMQGIGHVESATNRGDKQINWSNEVSFEFKRTPPKGAELVYTYSLGADSETTTEPGSASGSGTDAKSEGRIKGELVVSLASIFRRVLIFDQGEVDIIVLTNGDGKVLLNHSPEKGMGQKITNLPFLMDSQDVTPVLKLQSHEEKSSKDHPQSLKGSQVRDVTLAESSYKCFVQPIQLPQASDGSKASQEIEASEVWYLAAMVNKDKWRLDSMRITPTFLLAATLILLLGLLLMPYLRVRFIGQREGLNFHTVRWVLGSIMGLGILLTLAILYILTLGKLMEGQSGQLLRLNREIHQNFLHELRLIVTSMDQMNEVRSKQTEKTQQIRNGLHQNNTLDEVLPYRNAFTMVWTDGKGTQQEKWYTGPNTTPFLNVSERPYFKNAARGNFQLPAYRLTAKKPIPKDGDPKEPSDAPPSDAPPSDTPPADTQPAAESAEPPPVNAPSGTVVFYENPEAQRLYLQSIYSRNTGKYEFAISRASQQATRERGNVETMFTSPYSLTRPVLPPGCGFAVIDPTGLVLFHSSENKILRENFLLELGEKERDIVAAHVQARAPLRIPIAATYGLETLELFAAPLGESNWTLITFANREATWSIAVDTLTATLVYLFPFLILIVLLTWIGSYMKPRTTPYAWFRPAGLSRARATWWYWPRYDFCLHYQNIFLVLFFIFLSWLAFYSVIETERLWELTLVTALTTLIWVQWYLRAHRASHSDRHVSSNYSNFYYWKHIKTPWEDFFAGIVMGLLWMIVGLVLQRDISLGNKTLIVVASICILIAATNFRLVYWCALGALWYTVFVVVRWDLIIAGDFTEIVFALLLLAIPIVMPLIEFLRTHVDKWLKKTVPEYDPTQYFWKHWYTMTSLCFLTVIAILPTISLFLANGREQLSAMSKWRVYSYAQQLQERASELENEMSQHLPAAYLYTYVSGMQQLYHFQDDLSEEERLEWMSSQMDSKPFGYGNTYSAGDFVYSGLSSNPDELKTVFSVSTEPFMSGIERWLPTYYQLTPQIRAFASSEQEVDSIWGKHWFTFDQLILYSHSDISLLGHWPTLPIREVLILLCIMSALLWVFIGKAIVLIFLLTRHRPKMLETTFSNKEHRLYLRCQPEEPSPEQVLTLSSQDIATSDVADLLSRCTRATYKTYILLPHFHLGLNNPTLAEKKLTLLEGLLDLQGKYLILTSDIEPLFFFSSQLSDKLRGEERNLPDLQRWATVMGHIRRCRTAVGFENFQDKKDHLYQQLKKLLPEEPDETLKNRLSILAGECCHHPEMAQHIAMPLAQNEHLRDLNFEQIVEQVLFLAQPYYRSLWALCSIDEKMVLYTIAKDGFANWRNLDLIHKLIRRGLLLDIPHFDTFSVSFRQFVLHAELPETFNTWEAQAGRSVWQRLLPTLRIAAVALALFFFVTQRDLFLGVVGAVAAVSAGLPTLLGIFSRKQVSTTENSK